LDCLIGCMNRHCLISLPTLLFSNLIQWLKYFLFGKRMLGIENSSKPERDSFLMLSWLNLLFLKTLWKSIDHCLIFNKIVPFQAVFHRIVLGKRQILTLSNNQFESQPQLNIKTSLQERWQQLSVKFKMMFTKNVTSKKSSKKMKWNSVSK